MNQEKSVFRQINSMSTLKAVWNVSVLGLLVGFWGCPPSPLHGILLNSENDFLPWIV